MEGGRGKGEGLVLKPKPRFNTRIDPWWQEKVGGYEGLYGQMGM